MSISILVSARFASGLWGLRPPGASRCCARTSLPTPRGEPRFGVDRAPSRPHPPHEGASPASYIPPSGAIRTSRHERGEEAALLGALVLPFELGGRRRRAQTCRAAIV